MALSRKRLESATLCHALKLLPMAERLLGQSLDDISLISLWLLMLLELAQVVRIPQLVLAQACSSLFAILLSVDLDLSHIWADMWLSCVW